MQIVSLGDNLHESQILFSGKNKLSADVSFFIFYSYLF